MLDMWFALLLFGTVLWNIVGIIGIRLLRTVTKRGGRHE